MKLIVFKLLFNVIQDFCTFGRKSGLFLAFGNLKRLQINISICLLQRNVGHRRAKFVPCVSPIFLKSKFLTSVKGISLALIFHCLSFCFIYLFGEK